MEHFIRNDLFTLFNKETYATNARLLLYMKSSSIANNIQKDLNRLNLDLYHFCSLHIKRRIADAIIKDCSSMEKCRSKRSQ